MKHWLVKEEPTHYSFADLTRDGGTEWSGVRNALAQRYLRMMRPGDTGFYYHSGEVRAIVGVFRVDRGPEPETGDDVGRVQVRLRPESLLPNPVTLAAIKADAAFRQFELVRISRLSVMPVPSPLWSRILSMSRRTRSTDQPTSRKTRRSRA